MGGDLIIMNSAIDIKQLLYSAPKAELHVHLEGSLSLDFWRQYDLKVFNAIQDFNRAANKSLGLFVDCMELIHRSLDSAQAYYLAIKNLLAQLIAENVKYVEITWAPSGIYEFHGVLPAEVFVGIKRAIDEVSPVIDCRILVDVIRSRPVAVASMLLDWLGTQRPAEVVGINFGGDEVRVTVDKFLDVFKYARSLGLGITIHAGEAVSEDVTIDAIRKVRPDRIGHGTSLVSQAVRTEIMQLALHVEACPTSNFVLGYLPSPEAHPVLCDGKISVSINTDDRTFFSNSLTDELNVLYTSNKISLDNIAVMQINAIDNAFAAVKTQLMHSVRGFWQCHL